MSSGKITVNVSGYGTFEISSDRVGEVIQLLRSLQACKVNCSPVMEQGNWGGQVLLNENNNGR